MAARNVGSNEARQQWGTLLETIAAGKDEVIITRYGKPVVAMLRYEDYVAVMEELNELRQRPDSALPRTLTCEELLTREWDTPEENEAWEGWSEIDRLAAEIGERWPDGVSAADAVSDDRRDL